jgi:hypothetical protein
MTERRDDPHQFDRHTQYGLKAIAPNAHGVLDPEVVELVAVCGRASAWVKIARCVDGLYRSTAALTYSRGGFAGPIQAIATGYPTYDRAKQAGLFELLGRWPNPAPWEPREAHEELSRMRRQIEALLRQPALL